MRRHVIAVTLGIIAILPSSAALAGDEDYVAAARAIEALVVSTVEGKHAVVDCSGGAVAINRWRIFSHSIDIKHSDSVLYPYTLLLFLDIESLSNVNSPRANGVRHGTDPIFKPICFKSLSEAEAANGPEDFIEGNIYNRDGGRLIYQLGPEGYKLTGAIPNRFYNLFARRIVAALNVSVWGPVLGGPLPR